MSKLENIKLQLAKFLPESLLTEITDYRVKLSESVTPIVTKLASEAKLKDGTAFTYEGEKLEVGVKVTGVEDGEKELEDGSTMVVAGGIVTELKPKAEAPIEVPMADPVAQFKSQLESQKTDFDTKLSGLVAKLEVLEKGNLLLAQSLEKLLNTPIQFSQHISIPEKKYEDMTMLEKRRYERDNNS